MGKAAEMSDPQRDIPFVLIADDDADTLNILVLLAESKGWRVDTATTAREIIAKVNHHCSVEGRCYDAILSDVNLADKQPGPRLTGISAVGEIRKSWAHIPVVFYSAFLNAVMRDEIKRLGNADAVEKLGRASYGGASTDPIGVIEKVELVLKWGRVSGAGYEGQDRREGPSAADGPHPHRRLGDCQGEIRVPQALESALKEATVLREMERAMAAPAREE